MRRCVGPSVVAGFAFTMAAASCASSGGRFATLSDASSDAPVAKADAKVRDGASLVDGEDPPLPFPDLDAGRDAADAKVPPKPDASAEAGPVAGQCFDTGLGATRAIVKPTAGQLVISEWMPNPTAVTDANGEWFELHATANFDLNGVQAGTTSLGAAFTSANCVPVTSGQFVLFARNATGATNGLGTVTVDVVTTVSLVNASGTLMIGVDGTVLDTVTWATPTAGKSIMIDGSNVQCIAPAAVTAYNATDIGTPRAANTVACP